MTFWKTLLNTRKPPNAVVVKREAPWVAWTPWALGLCFAGIVGFYAVRRVCLGAVGVSDLAIFHSALLGSLRERFYFTYLHPHGTLFYQHFDPVALVLLPFYALLGNAAWPVLPLSQALAVGCTIPGAARMVRQDGGSVFAALFLASLLLFNPLLHNIVWYDFHPFVFSLPLLLWGWVLLREGRLWIGSLCWAGAMLCKENVPLTVCGLGVALLLEGRRRLGAAWIIASLFSFLLIVTVIIPSFREYGEGNVYLSRYAWLGASPSEIATTLLLRPFYVIGQVFSNRASVEFVTFLLLALGFLPILAPRRLLAATSEAATLLLSTFAAMQTLKFHYPAALYAVFIIAASRALAALLPAIPSRAKGLRWKRIAGWALCAVALLGTLRLLYSHGRTLPFLKNPKNRGYYVAESPQRRQAVRDMAGAIEPEASMSLPLNLLNPTYPFLERSFIAFLPDRADRADYVVFDTKTRYFGGHKEPGFDEALARYAASAEYEKVFDREGFEAFRLKRKKPLAPMEKRKSWTEADDHLQ